MFVNVQQWHEDKEQVIVMLHGFTGSVRTWAHVAEHLPDYRVVAIDLIGHGQTDAPGDARAYEMAEQLRVLEEVFESLQLTQFVLVGYSMGGRIALSYAVNYPKRVQQLILESASPGLQDDTERAARKQSDDTLAQKIEQNGVASFVAAWENIPLFASQKHLSQAVQAEIRTERLMQRATGLANSLRGIGTGIMPPLWRRLSEMTCPVLLVTGQLDQKFVAIAQKMHSKLKNSKHITINDAGHAIHVENPTKFATIVKETISQL